MKNQYFGDINDYRKYGILRCIASAGWRTGVCWMLTADDGRSDGGKIAYLKDSVTWTKYDPQLFAALALSLGGAGGRHIRHAQTEEVLPNACFYDTLVPDAALLRRAWFTNALAALGSCDLLFFDPDNGLEVSSKRSGSRGSSKFLYWDEVAEAWQHRKSLLIFQHFPRERRNVFIPRIVAAIANHTPASTIMTLTTSNVLFLLAVRAEHIDRLERLTQTLHSRWAGQIFVDDLRPGSV